MSSMSTSEDSPKALLRWAGSKKKILSHLSAYWQSDSKRYVEIFAGSAQLFFSLQPKRAIINDINADLIETYKTISRYPTAVYNIYANFPRSEKFYYHLREKFYVEKGKKMRAAMFVYLNRNCFNGLFRVNNSGKFNVPYSNNTGVNKWTLEEWTQSANVLKKAKFYSEDFEVIIKKHVRSGDFVYLDPPYALDNRRIFTQYSNASFGNIDILRLQNMLDLIDSRGAKFVLSYASCEQANFLASRWIQHSLLINRNISGFSKFRKREKELIITNISKLGCQKS